MVEKNLIQRVAAKAVIEAKASVLALHPSDIDVNRKWHIPGGIRDDINEPLEETLIREVIEETSIDLTGIPGKVFKIGEWPAIDKGERVKILAVFFHFLLPERPKVILSEEHVDFVWLDATNYQNYEANKEVYEVVESLLKK